MEKWVNKAIFGGFMTGLVLIPHTVLAAGENLPDANPLKDWILGIVGTCLIAYMAVGLFKSFIQQKWGTMVALILGGSLVAWICYFPDSFISVLKAFVQALGA